jgi:hypothetical protein
VSLPTGAPKLRGLIEAVAAYALPTWRSLRYRRTFLPGEWLEGLILAESGGNPRARRFELHHDRSTRRDAAADPDTCDADDGLIEDDASYGLVQILGSNIRALCGGLPLVVVPEFNSRPVPAESIHVDGAFWAPMHFGFAFLPATNIVLGVRVLRAELDAVGGDVERALARYNGGGTGDDVKPEYGHDMRLRRYVDRIAEHSKRVQLDRAEQGWRSIAGDQG